MRFEHPQILAWLWAVALGGGFLLWGFQRKTDILKRFSSEELLKEIASVYDARRDILKRVLLVFVFTFGIVSLARPQWGFEWQEVKRRGLDILVVIDTSRSMLTQDVKPNRLERTKLAVKELMRKLEGDRIGLIAFAGKAFLVCPLTTDYQGFLLSLENLDSRTIPRGGTNIAEAISEAIKEYDATPSKYKAVVILTDGESLEDDPMPAAQRAKAKGIKIYTIGVGTKEGELVKVQNEEGEWEFLKDKGGNFIKSRLNEKLLQDIALTTGGVYVRSSGAEFGLDLIYEHELSGQEKRDIKSRMEKKYFERYQIPLAIALILLVLESLLPVRRKSPPPVVLTGMLILFAALATPSSAWALGEGSIVNDGNRFYQQGQYDKALEKYSAALGRQPESALLHFNAGTAAYQTKNYDTAIEHLQQSLLSDERPLQSKAHHNLGNAFYRRGMAKENIDLNKAVADLEQSLEHYQQSLSLQPGNDKDKDTSYNYEFVKKELDRLKKKREQQNQQKQQQQNPQKQPSGGSQQKQQPSPDNSKNQDHQNNQNDGQNQENSSGQDQQQNSNRESQQQSPQNQPNHSDEQGNNPRRDSAEQPSSEQRGKDEASSESTGGKSYARTYSPEEAEMLLNDYQQNEEPRGLLNFMKGKGRGEEDYKDW